MMNASAAEEEYDDAFEEIIDDNLVPGQQDTGAKRQVKPRSASNRGRP